MKFDRYLKEFEDYLEACAFSERTVDTYTRYAKRFTTFLETYYPRIGSFEKVTKDIILDYQNYISTCKTDRVEKLSNQTRCIILRALKKLFFFLMKRDLVLKDPTTVMTMPREEQRLIRNILTENESFNLLENINTNTPIGLRNRAIAELFYACGIRTSELCNLKVQDVDFKEQTVTIIKGKGNKSRMVPIGQYASHYIQVYLEKARKYMLRGKREDPGYLFLSQRGNPFDKSTINKTAMKSITRTSGIKKHISCYSFRHSVASQLLKNKLDIMYIAQLLGHKSLKTTQRYLNIDISDLKKMHNLFHPRER